MIFALTVKNSILCMFFAMNESRRLPYVGTATLGFRPFCTLFHAAEKSKKQEF